MITTRSSRITRPLHYLALICYLIFLAFPLVFLAMFSLKSQREVASPDPSFFPRGFEWGNFSAAIEKTKLFRSARNSLVVAGATTVIVILISLPAAYALARFRTRLRGLATGWILLSQIFPFILIIIPLFLVLRDLKMVDTLQGLILVYTVWALPFSLWMLQGYVAAIPRELEDAASIDGASRLRVLRSIVLPLLAPGLVATSLFAFIGSWNEFFFALVLIQDEAKRTLPLTLSLFIGSEGRTNLGQLAAASLLSTVPSLAFFVLIQRRLTSGLLSGAVKG